MGDDAATQEFWRSFMKTDEAQEALKAQYEEEYEMLADKYERTVKPDELRELGEALLDVSKDLQRVVAPVLKYDFAQRLLYGLLQECRRLDRDFSEHLAHHQIRQQLEELGAQVRANPGAGPEINEKWRVVFQHVLWKIMSEKIADDNGKDRFGPAHARYVDVHELCALLNQGSLCLEMGTEKFKEKNWDLALDRYTMGVNMLQNARSKQADNDSLLTATACRLLKNQAACALKLERWGLAARACDKALALRPADPKALYRKGVAELKRGDVEASERCFREITMLEAPTMDEAFEFAEARREAERQLAVLRRRKASSKDFARAMGTKALEKKGLFLAARENNTEGDGNLGKQPKAAREDVPPVMDEGLRHHISQHLEAEKGSAAPTLSVDEVLEFQAELKALYAEPEFRADLDALKKKNKEDMFSLEKAPTAAGFLDGLRTLVERRRQAAVERRGFATGPLGFRAIDRAVARHLDDPRVSRNAADLVAVLLDGVDLATTS